ncbi:MAG: serine protease [Deltaproteobacteria bacterium]|nr:serine protease [Deltaproteobacteria bacterium]
MPRIKVFVDKQDRKKVLEQTRLIEAYDAFVLVEASDAVLRALARRYPVEDISNQYALQIGQRSVNPAARGRKRGVDQMTAGLADGPHHYVIQFIGPVKQSWLTAVRATGAKLRNPYGNFGYIVWARPAMLAKIAELRFVHFVEHLAHQARLAPGLTGPAARGDGDLPRRQVRPGVYSVEIFDASDTERIARAARTLGFKVLSKEARAKLLLVESTENAAPRRKQLQDLCTVHGVRFIRERALRRTSNNVATGIMGNVFTATATNGLKLAGDGEVVAVCDTGLDTGDTSSIHADFAGRIVAIKSYPITPDWNSIIFNTNGDDGPADLDSGHGTHVAGSVLGNGAASSSGPAVIRGHAHKAKLVFQAIEQEMKWRPNAPAWARAERYLLSGIPANLRPLFQFARNQGARVHSNSWGGGDAGAYDDQCEQFDQFVWDNKDFCFVIAAGNDGTDNDGDGKINLTSVTSPGTAKNCVTVGACENLRPEFNTEKYGEWWPGDFPVNPIKGDPMANNAAQVVAFSSRGPTLDGRVKPEVVAPGTFILSTRSSRLAPNNFAWGAYPTNHKYFHMGGTSMATPLVAGALAVIREFLRKKRNIANPSAALLKALLIAGAQRLTGTAPVGTILDNHQGFGRVNLDRSLKTPLLTVDAPGLTTGEKATFTVAVPTSSKALRIALAYTDFPSDTLVNNLNLMATDPSGKRYIGNRSNVSQGPIVFDANNNAEAIHASNAKKGSWSVEVIASNVTSVRQDFALAAVLI